MNLTISGHHIDVTPAIRHHVEEKLLPIQRHGDHITRLEVTLIVEKHLHKAETNSSTSAIVIFPAIAIRGLKFLAVPL